MYLKNEEVIIFLEHRTLLALAKQCTMLLIQDQHSAYPGLAFRFQTVDVNACTWQGLPAKEELILPHWVVTFKKRNLSAMAVEHFQANRTGLLELERDYCLPRKGVRIILEQLPGPIIQA